MKTLCIIGGAGFIGTNLLEFLKDNSEYKVICIYHQRPPYIRGKNISAFQADILDKKKLEKIIPQDCFLVHLANFISFKRKDFYKMYRINVEGTKNIIEVSLNKRIKKLIFISAGAVYGVYKNPVLINETFPLKNTRNPYAYTKIKAEKIIEEAKNKGLNAIILNPSTVYGKYDWKLNSSFLIKYIYKNKFLICPPGGTSGIGAGDLIRAIILLIEKETTSFKFIVSSYNFTYKELFLRISKVLNKKPLLLTLPEFSLKIFKSLFRIFENLPIFIASSTLLEESFRFKFFDNYLIRKELGWKPQDKFEDVIKESVVFLKEKGLLC